MKQNKEKGWICLYRSLLDWEWFDSPSTLSVFIFCLLRANHTDATWHGITLNKGQLFTSYQSIAKATGLSIQSVRTAMSRLKSTKEVTNKSTKVGQLITVVRYSEYQDGGKRVTKKLTKEATDLQQTSNRPPTTDNNEEQLNKDNLFEIFWKRYPKKIAKPIARKAWDKVELNKDNYMAILAGLEKHKQSEQWAREGGKYIPHASTWLNQERWLDDLKVEVEEEKTPLDYLPDWGVKDAG